jgi:quinoprotein relay system zinc metallohydrolase 2
MLGKFYAVFGIFRVKPLQSDKRSLCLHRAAVLVLAAAILSAAVSQIGTEASAEDGPPPQTAAPLAVTEVAPGIFFHQGAYALAAPANGGGIANIGFVVGEDAVAVIDTGGTPREGLQLKAAIRQRTQKPIRYVINTHMHPDHVLGNMAFKGEAQFIGHFRLSHALAVRGDYYLKRAGEILGEDAVAGEQIVPPDIVVEDRKIIDLGGRKLILQAWPTAHTDNDLTIYDENTHTFMLGDLLFVRHIPALDGSLKGWLAVMDRLARQPAERAVPGHGPLSVPWPQALEKQRQYLTLLLTGVRKCIAAGTRIAEAAKTVGLEEKDAWLLFDEYNARNVSAAYAELEWE